MNKKFEYQVSNWCFDKLEQRILLSGEAMIEPVNEQDNSGNSEEGAGEILTVNEKAVEEVAGIKDYQPQVDGALVNLNDDGVLPEEQAAAANVLPENSGLTDIHLTPDEILKAPEGLVVDDNEILTGSGNVAGSVVNEGTVSPGNSPGVVTVTGDYTQTADSSLVMEIGGKDNSGATKQFDQINVSETATFSGTLDLRMWNNFVPTAGDVYNIITYKNRTGEFSEYKGLEIGDGLCFKVVYTDTALQLQVVETPKDLEPEFSNTDEFFKYLDFIADTTNAGPFEVEGGFKVGEQTVSGKFKFSRVADGYDIVLSEATARVGGGASLLLKNGSGAFFVNADGVAGSLVGDVSIEGLNGVTVQGTGITYKFNTIAAGVNHSIGAVKLDFAGVSAVNLGGNMKLKIDNLADMSGNFVIEQFIETVDGEEVSTLRVDGKSIASKLGVSGTGADLTDGWIAMIITNGADGKAGYALNGAANIALASGTGITMTGSSASLKANTLGRKVDESWNISGDARVIKFDAADQVHMVDVGSFDMTFNKGLADSVDSAAVGINTLKSKLVSSVDDDGNIINPSILAETIPGTDSSLESLLGMTDVLNIGDYVRAYLQPLTGVTLEGEAAALVKGDYSATGNKATLQGLRAYLVANWPPASSGIVISLVDGGFRIGYLKTTNTKKNVEIDLGKKVSECGLTLDETLTVEVDVARKMDFGVVIDWGLTSADFELGNMDYSVTANLSDLELDASYGALGVQLGDNSIGKGASLTVDLSGRLDLDADDNFTNTVVSDKITANLPVFATISGQSLSGDNPARIIVEGSPFSSGDDFSYRVQNFDSFRGFNSFTVGQVILLFPEFMNVLDEMRNANVLVKDIPFLEGTLDQAYDFGTSFNKAVYSKILFHKPSDSLLTGLAGSVVKDSMVMTVTAGIDWSDADIATKLLNQQVAFGGAITRQIKVVDVAKKTITFSTAFDENATLSDLTVAAKWKQIQTIQEFTKAVNDAGVLPLGMKIEYDVAEGKFSVPLGFTHDLAEYEQALVFDYDMGELTGLRTDAKGKVKTTVNGGLKLFFDLGDKTVAGTGGTIKTDEAVFTSADANFDDSLVGYMLEVGGHTFKVADVSDAHTLLLSATATEDISGADFVLNEGARIGVEDVKVSGKVTVTAEDPIVAANIGFIGVTAGHGADSEIKVESELSGSLTKAGDNTQFSMSEIFDGSFIDAFNVELTGKAHAVLQGIKVDPGLGDDLNISDNAQVAIYVQDFINPGKTVNVYQSVLEKYDLSQSIADGKATAKDVVLVTPDLGDPFAFKDASFLDIIRALRMGIDFINNGVGESAFYNADIPILNFSLSETLNLADDFLAILEKSQENPAGTIQDTESVVEEALGIKDNNSANTFDQVFALYLEDDGSLGIHLDYKQYFQKLCTFNLDLKTLQVLGGGKLEALTGMDMLSDVLGQGAAANIQLDGFFDMQLDAGISFPGEGDPEIFLYDSDPDKVVDPTDPKSKRGTKAKLAYRVVGEDLNMQFETGPLTLGVEGGTAFIDGDGNISTKGDYATLVVHLDQISNDNLTGLSADELAAIPADDGRYMFDVYKDDVNLGAENIKHNLKAAVSGKFSVDLPVRLDFDGFESHLGNLQVKTADGKDLSDLMNALNNPQTVPAQPIVQISTPNIYQKFKDAGGSYDLLAVLNDPGVVIDGIDDSLGLIQDVFLDGFGVKLPLVGDVLSDFSGFINDIRINLLADLREDLTVEGGLIGLVQQTYYDVFANKLHILKDSNKDGKVSKDDVTVNWFGYDSDMKVISLGNWKPDGELPLNAESVQFDMELGGHIVGGDVDIPLDINLPGFDFKLDGGFGLDMDWSLDFGTGISGQEGFYLVTQDDSDPEFKVDVDILLDSDTSNGKMDPFTGVGKLNFFKAKLVDKDHDPDKEGFQASGLRGTYSMDFVGDERGRMNMNYISSTPVEKMLVDEFYVDTDIQMSIELEVESDAVPMPKLIADFIVDADYSSKTEMGTADIGFTDFGIDVDSLVNDFLLPITNQVDNILSPMYPVIDALYAKVPGLDKFGIDSVMDLIDTAMKLQGKRATDWGFVKAVNAIRTMPETVEGWAENGGIIYLGDITGLGTSDTKAEKKSASDGKTTEAEQQKFLADLEAQENSVDSKGSGGAGESSARSGFKYLEYITDISNWMKILTGGDATLFTYEMPIMRQNAHVDVPIYGVKVPPVKFGVFAVGDINLQADMSFGYDTAGLRKYMNTGNPIDAFDGFYVSNVTMPKFLDGSIVPGTGGKPKDEVMFDVFIGLEAGLKAGPLKAGLDGGIVFDADFNLKDIEKSVLTKDSEGYVTNVKYVDDGRVRMSEILTMYGYQDKGFIKGFNNLYNIETETSLESNAYVDAKIPLVGKKRIVDVTLFKATLYEKDILAPTVKPTLGVVDGGVLTVNAGSLAESRKYFNTDDSGENIWLYSDKTDSGKVSIEFEGWYQTFDNVNKVVIDLGDGDDTLDASRLDNVFLDIRGGSGDDRILLGSGGAHVRGEEGDDTIIAKVTSTTGVTLDGGAGRDRLVGAQGNDTLIGGSGNDRLEGNAGADSLEGGTGADQLRGGAGNDTYVFRDNYGTDRFSDSQGEISLDFSAVTKGLDMTVGRSGVRAVNADMEEFRISSGKVTSITLSAGDDNVRFRDFVDWSMEIVDNGGNDDYRFTMGRAAARGATGTYQITDNAGDFDEIIATQTKVEPALFINSGQVENGREVVNYTAGVERLTLLGNGADYNGEEIKSFGGRVHYDTKDAGNVSNLGSTGFRVIADEILMDSQIRAAHVILDSMESINLDERVASTADGYVEIRTYGDASDIKLNADVLVSAGNDFDGDGSGWIRMISADGSILNESGTAEIIAAGSYVQLKAKNGIGTKESAILTTIKNLTAITNGAGAGDIVLTEADDLNLIVERSLSGDENPGFRFDSTHGDDRWESNVKWDDTVASDWTTVLKNGRTDYALEVGNGDLVLTQSGKDALLSLKSGDIHNRKDSGNISLTVDDIDFVSGAEKVIGSGELNIKANQLAWRYLFGYAAESPLVGNEWLRNDANSDNTLTMGMRDFAALADGFSKVSIGRSGVGNRMIIGDLLHATNVKRTPSISRDLQATLRDHTVFLSEDLRVEGDVRADDNTVELRGTTITVQNYNIHGPVNDSGLTARDVVISAKDQLHVGGWIVADDSVDIDVTDSKGTNPTTTGAYVTGPNGIYSMSMDAGSRIETLNADSRISIDTSGIVQIAGTVENKGDRSVSALNAGTDFLLVQGGRMVSSSAESLIDINAGGVLALNSGTATFAGIRYADDKVTPVLTGSGADIRLTSAHEMLIAGSLTVSDKLTVSSGKSKYDNENFGDPDHADYFPKYEIYNKTKNFQKIASVDAENYLVNHDSGYGLMITSEVTSLGANQDIVFDSTDDVIIRGDIHAKGAGSTITMQSDSFTYIDGFVDAAAGLTVTGGYGAENAPRKSDSRGSSVYVNSTGLLRTSGVDADILIKGFKDVDLYGSVVAGGKPGENGIIWSGKGSDISVTAGEQLFLETGLQAAGNVNVVGGSAGADDKSLGLVVSTAGGMSANGYAGQGGNITITGPGNMEMMGTLVAGGSLFQEFKDGKLVAQRVNWSGTEGEFNVDMKGLAYIGGHAKNVAGEDTTTGGYIHSAGDVTIKGGANESGMGVRVHGSAEIGAKKADADIFIKSVGNTEVLGFLAAGGQINEVRDISGTLQGRDVETYGGASSIRIEADDKIEIGVALKAGKSIDLIGGSSGIQLHGSAQLETWMENSSINLNAPGTIEVMAPGHTNEILAQAWPISADGKLAEDVVLDLVLNRISHDIAAKVTISASDTADNNLVNDLIMDIQKALNKAKWKVSRSDVDAYKVGDSYTKFEAEGDMSVKLRDGRLNLTGPYATTLKSTSTNANLLGFDTSSELTSGIYYAIDAGKAGSVVNLGAESGPNAKVYVAGKVIADKAINMYSGVSADGKDIEIDATGVLETVNGSIKFNAGKNGEIWGNIFAKGAGSDIVLNSDESLTIHGKLDACNDVIVNSGKDVSADKVGLLITGTSKITSSGGGGRIELGTVNDMLINGVVGTGSTALSEIAINSEHGKVTLVEESGFITADAKLGISAQDIDVQGVIISTAANADGAEVDIDAAKSLTVQSSIYVDNDLRLHAGKKVDIFNSVIEVKNSDSTLTVASDDDISTSRETIEGDKVVYQGALVQGRGIVTFNAADELTIGNATLLGTSDADSRIVVEASTVNVIGSVLAGATVKDGKAKWTGDNSVVDVNVVSRLNMGGEISDEDATTVLKGGSLRSSGDLTIDVSGGSEKLSINQNDLSTIIADGIDGEVSRNVIINTDHEAYIAGVIQAKDKEGTVKVTTGDKVRFNGIVEAGKNITVNAGDDSYYVDDPKTSATSIITQDHVYKHDVTGKYFLDSDGNMMDAFGYLVNSEGKYIDKDGNVLAAGADKVQGGDPIRMSGATFDVAAGGTMDFNAVDDMYLGGHIGRPVVDEGKQTAHAVEINIHSTEGSSNVGGVVNALDKINFTGKHASVLSGGVVQTRTDIGEIYFNVDGNILVSGDDGEGGDAIVSAAERVHFYGDSISLGGNISATADSESLVLVNGISSILVSGKLFSAGNVELRGGVGADWTEDQLTAASVDVLTLDDALVKVLEDGSVHSEGDINIISGGDFDVASKAVLGKGEKNIQTPMIVNKTKLVDVVTGSTKVYDGVINVPVVKWITTKVTEQSGFEMFKVGTQFNKMEVNITQKLKGRYYNPKAPAGQKFRDFFIEDANGRGDYSNAAINWGKVTPPSGAGHQGFEKLTYDQKIVVLNKLGYKPLFDFSSSNHFTYRDIKGALTQTAWNPQWLVDYRKSLAEYEDAKVRAKTDSSVDPEKFKPEMEIVNIDISGWRDKYIEIPKDAVNDILKVVQKGDVGDSTVKVGTKYEKAKVKYTQFTSAHEASVYRMPEPWEKKIGVGDSWSAADKLDWNDGDGDKGMHKVVVTDYDATLLDKNGKPLKDANGNLVRITDASWKVSYENKSGTMYYVIDDGHVGYHDDTPDWLGGDTTWGVEGKSGGNLSDFKASASGGFFTDTSSLENKTLVATHKDVEVGVDGANGGKGYRQRYYDIDKKSDPGRVKVNCINEYWYLQEDFKKVYSGNDTNLYRIGAYFKNGARWHDGTKIPSQKYGDVAQAGGEGNIFWGSYGGNSYQLHDTKKKTSKRIVEHEAGYTEGKVTEDYHDYTYNWTSKARNVYDRNFSATYKYTSVITDYNAPSSKTDTKVKPVKSVLSKQITKWRNVPIIEQVAVPVTERQVVEGKLVGWGKFETNALEAEGNINVITADDIAVSGQVKGIGEKSTVSLTAGGDITVDGNAPSGGVGNEISAEALIESPEEICIDAKGTVTFGSAATVRTTLEDVDIVVNAGADSVLDGDMDSLDTIRVQADGDVKVGGYLKAANYIDIQAGADGSGGFTGGEGALLEVTSAPEAEKTGEAEAGTVESGESTVAEGGESSEASVREKGVVYLTSGNDSGDMLLTNASISTLGHIELTAEGGSVQQTGGVIDTAKLIGRSKNGFSANTSINTLSVTNSGDGGLSIVNTKALEIADFDTAGGGIDVTTFGALTAGRLTTAGMDDDDDVNIRVFGAGVTYNTISVGEGGDGDISIKVQGSITNLGEESRMIGDEITIEVPGEIDIVTNANSVDLFSYQRGNITVRDISDDGLEIKKIRAVEGEVSVTAKGDLGVKSVQVLSERRDLDLTSGGKVYGIDNDGTISGSDVDKQLNGIDLGAKFNIYADQLTVSAQSGIESLKTSVSELKDVATVEGDVEISNTRREVTSDELSTLAADGKSIAKGNIVKTTEELVVTIVVSGKGNVSIDTDGDMTAYTARAEGAGSKLTLRSSDEAVIVRDTGAAEGIWGEGSLELDAATKLDLEVNVDTANDLILRSGTLFEMPTTGTYRARNITIDSDDDVRIDGDLVFGGGTFEFITKRDVTLSGTISASDGSAVELLKASTSADNPEITFKRDTDLFYVICRDSKGNEVLRHTDGKVTMVTDADGNSFSRQVGGGYGIHRYNGKFAYKARYLPEGADAKEQSVIVLAANADGSGNIYSKDGVKLDLDRYVVLDKSFVDVTRDVDESDLEEVTVRRATGRIQLDLGDGEFDSLEISAGGTVGVVDIDSNRDLNLEDGYIRSTGDIDINTKGQLTVGKDVIGGVAGNDPEFINLTSGSDMIVDSELKVVDGQRWFSKGMVPVEGTVTLKSGGTISSTVDSVTARGTKLVTIAEGEVSLTTAVDKLDSVISGSGKLNITDKGSLLVENAQLGSGVMNIAAENDIEVVNLKMGEDKVGNAVLLTSFNGDVYVDLVDSGSKGLVVVNANGDLKELAPHDPENDIIANVLLAMTESTTTDVERKITSKEIIGRSRDISLDIDSDFYLFGDFGGTVDLRVHGKLYVADTSAKNYTLTVDETARVEGDLVSTGVVEVRAQGVDFTPDGSLAGKSVNINSGSEGLSMAEGSSMSAGTGGMVVTSAKDMLLSSLSSAGNMTLNSIGGAILDNKADESANITASGNISLKAGNGIGIQDGEDIDTAISGKLSAEVAAGGINIQDKANLVVGSAGLKAESGAVNLVADNNLTLEGSVTSVAGATTLSGRNVSLAETGAVKSAGDTTVSAVNGAFSQHASSTVDSDNGSVVITAGTDVNAASVTAAGNVSIAAQEGSFAQTDSSGIRSTGADVVIDAKTAANVKSLSAEHKVLVTSRAGTIFDESAADSAAVTSLNGVVNLNAAVDIGETDTVFSVDGKVTATAGGDIFLKGVNGLSTAEGGIKSGNGDVNLSSSGGIELLHGVEAAKGEVSIEGNTLNLGGTLSAGSVTSTVTGLTSMGQGSSITATDGDVELTSGSVVQAGNIYTYGDRNITVTSTDGTIQMMDDTGEYFGGAFVEGEGTIKYISATDLKAATFNTEGAVYLTAKDGSIEDAYDDAPQDFGPEHFGQSTLNVVAEALFADATAKIGDPEGNALDVKVKELSALSGEGTHIWARGGVKVVDPGLFVNGDGDLIVYSDHSIEFDPEAVNDPLHDISGEGVERFVGGFVVPPVVEPVVPETPVPDTTAARPDSGQLSRIYDRVKSRDLLANASDTAEQPAESGISADGSVLGEMFAQAAPELILDDLFGLSGQGAEIGADESGLPADNVYADNGSSLVSDLDYFQHAGSLVEEIAAGEGNSAGSDSLLGAAAAGGSDSASSGRSVLDDLGSADSGSGTFEGDGGRSMLFSPAQAGESFVFSDDSSAAGGVDGDSGIRGRDEDDFGAVESGRTTLDSSIVPGGSVEFETGAGLNMGRAAEGLPDAGGAAMESGVLPVIEGRDVGSLIQFQDGETGVAVPQQGANSALTEEEMLQQGLVSVQPGVAVEQVAPSQVPETPQTGN